MESVKDDKLTSYMGRSEVNYWVQNAMEETIYNEQWGVENSKNDLHFAILFLSLCIRIQMGLQWNIILMKISENIVCKSIMIP